MSDRAPEAAEIRAQMGIPSEGIERRGQKDVVGFASTPEQMALTWKESEAPPAPVSFGPLPEGAAAGLVCPHDDYILAGRVYRAAIPLVRARTVVLAGVFHAYRRFGMRNALVFDPYRVWRTPDGDVAVSTVREAWLDRLPPGDAFQDAAAHDAEHSIEAIAYWLRHQRPDTEIVPVLVPAMPFERLHEIAGRAGRALGAICRERGLALGKDLAVVISADAVHYGADFRHTPFGAGGRETYERAFERDLGLLREKIAGPVEASRVRALYEAFVNPEDPDEYRLTWCGRFSIPFGMLLLRDLAGETGAGGVTAHPVAYGTTAGWPPLPLHDSGLGLTAPANLEHFVGHAAVALHASAR